jgi:para-aminobenzoate synthetase component 1
MFFFEKKNQKTFVRCSQVPAQTGSTGGARDDQKFFGSFFQKRTSLSSAGLCFPLPWTEPVEVFRRFVADQNVTFFESRGQPGPRARYSYLCVDPFRVLRDVSLEVLAGEVARWRLDWPEAPVPFVGGAAGFCAYDMGASLERVRRAPGGFAGVPDMQFGLYDLVFAWDHAARRFWLLCAFAESRGRAERVLGRLRGALPAMGAAPALAWRAAVGRETHLARVERTLDYIRAGDIYQANVTAPFVAARPDGLDAASVFLALRAGNAAPFTSYMDCGGGCAVASVSPERFLALDREGRIEARPIKGTRPRGATPAGDAAEAAALLASGKDRAENLMIVDLLRNDISRVAVAGSVRVPVLCGLESFASVHHLVSVVEGVLRPGCSAVDLLRAAFPGGSITGAPKLRAMEIIAELEEVARGPYCGTAAWLGFDGAMDSSVLIRTVTVARDVVVAQAGGGIVAESDPGAEWEEVLVKARPMLRSLGRFG